MTFIFLDIDGVLNTPAEWGNYWRSPSTAINRGCVERLNDLMEQIADATIIVSSTWREDYSLDELKAFLAMNGFEYPHRIAGKTPIFKGMIRGVEINHVLVTKPHDGFVILDDVDNMGDLAHALVQTNSDYGLRDDDVWKAVRIAKKQ